jgi:hypothetical protein
MIIKTTFDETYIGFISDWHHDNFKQRLLNNIRKTFRNYFTKSLLSPTPCHNYENIL